MKKHTNPIITWGGRLLTLSAFVFVVLHMRQFTLDFTMLGSPAVVAGLVVAALALGLGVYLFAYNFIWLVQQLSGGVVQRKSAVKLYCATNLYKYLPINFMQFIGRNQIALEAQGVTFTHVNLATVLETAFRAMAAVLVTAVTVLNFMDYVRLTLPTGAIVAGIALVVVIMAVTLYFFRKRLTMRAMGVLLFNSALRTVSIAATYLAVVWLLGQVLSPAEAVG